VWQGVLDDTAARLQGPGGVRSDNVNLEFELAVGGDKARGDCQGGLQEGD